MARVVDTGVIQTPSGGEVVFDIVDCHGWFEVEDNERGLPILTDAFGSRAEARAAIASHVPGEVIA